MDIDNKYVQYMHRDIEINIYVTNGQGENLLDPQNLNAYPYDNINVSAFGVTRKIIPKEEGSLQMEYYPYIWQDDEGEYYLAISSYWDTSMTDSRIGPITITWADGTEDNITFESKLFQNKRYKDYIEHYYGYYFEIEFYLNGESVHKSDSPHMIFQIVK